MQQSFGTKSWIIKYWKGLERNNLIFSVVAFFVVLPFVFLLAYVFGKLSFNTDNLSLLLSVNILILLACYTLITWFVIGSVRSTLSDPSISKYRIKQFSKPSLKRVVVVVVVALVARPVSALSIDAINLFSAVQKENLEEGNATAELQSESVVLLSGTQSQVLYQKTKETLRKNPNLHLAILDSNGGSVYWAKKTAALIKSKRLSTHVNDQCLSSCSILFLAGANRTVSFYADIGFHVASTATGIGKTKNRSIQKVLLANGISQDLIDRIERYEGEEMLYLTLDELVKDGFVTEVTMPHLFFDIENYPIERIADASFPKTGIGSSFLIKLTPRQRQNLIDLLSSQFAPSVEHKIANFVQILLLSIDQAIAKSRHSKDFLLYEEVRAAPYSFTGLYGQLCSIYSSSKFIPSIFFDDTHNAQLATALIQALSTINSHEIRINLVRPEPNQNPPQCSGK